MNCLLITGGSGWIGRHVLGILSGLNHDYDEIHVVGRKHFKVEDTYFKWHRANLLNEGEIEELFRVVRPTHLLHLAWDVTPGEYLYSLNNYLWVRSSLALFNSFSKYGGKRLVVSGTCFEYGSEYGYCTESITPCSNITPYSTSKNTLRILMESFSEAVGLSSCWGRIFFLYGPYEHPKRLVSSVVTSLIKEKEAFCSEGLQYRDFLHVFDVANAFVSLLDKDVTGIINICSSNPIQVKQMILMIAEKLEKKNFLRVGALPLSKNEASFICGNNQRLINEINWRPKYDLDSGIESTILWWEEKLRGENQYD